MKPAVCNKATFALAALLLSALPCAYAQTSEAPQSPTYGAPYHPAPTAAADQAQVIYYRPMAQLEKPVGANVYLDGHFHASLLPGSFTLFCVPAGQYTLGAYQNDAPLYRGKNEGLFRAQLDAGKTYFVKVTEDGHGAPVSVERPEAEQALLGAREQSYTLSRASTEACKSLAAK
ncbi:OOP family OmpA-OmpF porin [Pseudomonas nitritireducens]|uniref:OOP family OmpA-OmpF porin n=1 Tax=Pseudomonas nitroreducens TaxID=46680 RepID=A0A7W7KNZ4_PSENT|nr:hypothetical protein [Pseudomonas nitritireducens]MBB4865798.1 OOP family OmpA-OmpF porin [Pseudomonas nitritireducens]